jgi:hypothetical protein
MATIKSYTDINQSKKLAEILPLESADMCIGNYVGKSGKVDGTNVHYYLKGETFGAPEIIAAWSLAALLEVLDDEITNEDGNDYNLTIIKENLQYQLYYHDSWGQAEDIETDYYDDMVDACYEMILKLNELNLL